MSEKEQKILETISKAIPTMSDRQKDKMLCLGEALAFLGDQQENQPVTGELTNG